MLSTDDYGIYTVFLSWLDIFEIFATMRMYSNGYMAGVVKNEADQEKYTCSIQFLSIATTSFALMFEIAVYVSYVFIILCYCKYRDMVG